jgi:sensor histidine kinase YesM
VSFIYPLTIIDIYDSIAAMRPSKAQEVFKLRNNLLVILLLIQLALMGIVFAVSIFISHKIAGPIYKLKKYLNDVTSGNTNEELFFRSGDYFKEIATDVNEFVEHFKDQRREDFEYLEEVSQYINNLSLVVPEDKKPVIKEITTKIKMMQERYD